MNPAPTPDPTRSLLEPRTIEEYVNYAQNTHDLIQWGGGKLKANNLIKRHYQWIFFPIFLYSGYYRIALILLTFPRVRPVTAYAVAFPPDAKNIEKYPLSPLGFGFHITPAVASKNRFEIWRNTTDFATPLTGEYTVAVTTRDWFSEVEEVIFEVALFKNKMEYRYK